MKPLIIANWKMNPKSAEEATALFDLIEKSAQEAREVEVVVCPSSIYLSVVKSGITKLGGQNCFWEREGAFTGEVSPQMLKFLGCEYVILGHSERRKYFQETDEMIGKKIKAALEAGLSPILCVGETEEQRIAGETEGILKNQLESAIGAINDLKFEVKNLNIAYEPVWAIGTGNACGTEDAKKANLFIREILFSIFGEEVKKIRILYGGSVKADNSATYLKKSDFNGLLVGGASLNADEFDKIIKSVL
jgi:triosephosphate isomerase (TIM)